RTTGHLRRKSFEIVEATWPGLCYYDHRYFALHFNVEYPSTKVPHSLCFDAISVACRTVSSACTDCSYGESPTARTRIGPHRSLVRRHCSKRYRQHDSPTRTSG